MRSKNLKRLDLGKNIPLDHTHDIILRHKQGSNKKLKYPLSIWSIF